MPRPARTGLDVVALAHDLRGLMLIRSGDLDGSLPEFDQAIALLAPRRGRTASAVPQPGHRPSLPPRPPGRSSRSRAQCRAGHRAGPDPRRVQGPAQPRVRGVPRRQPPAGPRHPREGRRSRRVVTSGVGLLDRARVLMEAGLLDEAESHSRRRVGCSPTNDPTRTGPKPTRSRGTRSAAGQLDAGQDPLGPGPPRLPTPSEPGWQARADVTRWQAYLDSKGGATRVTREIRSPDASPTGPPRPRGVAHRSRGPPRARAGRRRRRTARPYARDRGKTP